ncbi:MAG: alkaline phosphatase family protein [Ktedonobacterales bacterium]
MARDFGSSNASRLSRRRLLQGAAATGLAAFAAGCATSRPATRLQPTATLATAAPSPTAMPVPGSQIQRVVVFMKENHTFDNMFGLFPGVNGINLQNICADQLPTDMTHKHSAALDGATPEGRCQYNQAGISNYWSYATNYTLCDTFFSDIMGPSPANHLIFLTGEAPFVDYPPGFTPDDGWTCPNSCWDYPTIMDRVAAKGLTWRNYWASPWSDTFMIQHLYGSPYNVPFQQFITDAQAGNLPNLSFVKTSPDLSDHPPESMTAGENYQVREINAIINGGLWNNTAIFITWDDWGGFYDHVAPPVAETWTDGTPLRYGPRVPLLVLGPYARQG